MDALGTISDSVFGIMYAMTSGIMAWISLGALIPKAVEYDVERNIAVDKTRPPDASSSRADSDR